jgi:hypothetical protein
MVSPLGMPSVLDIEGLPWQTRRSAPLLPKQALCRGKGEQGCDRKTRDTAPEQQKRLAAAPVK